MLSQRAVRWLWAVLILVLLTGIGTSAMATGVPTNPCPSGLEEGDCVVTAEPTFVGTTARLNIDVKLFIGGQLVSMKSMPQKVRWFNASRWNITCGAHEERGVKSADPTCAEVSSLYGLQVFDAWFPSKKPPKKLGCNRIRKLVEIKDLCPAPTATPRPTPTPECGLEFIEKPAATTPVDQQVWFKFDPTKVCGCSLEEDGELYWTQPADNRPGCGAPGACQSAATFPFPFKSANMGSGSTPRWTGTFCGELQQPAWCGGVRKILKSPHYCWNVQ